MNEHFARIVAATPGLFVELARSAPFPARASISYKGKAGVYAFFENGQPVHVGRTRNLQGRLRGHITRSHNSASFAFKQTRHALQRYATYRPEGSRAALTKDPMFGPEFERQIARVKMMEVHFLEIADSLAQYLLELYAHMEWGLPLDEFDTH